MVGRPARPVFSSDMMEARWQIFLDGWLGFGVRGSGFRVQGSGFRVQGLGLRAQGVGLGVTLI